MCILYTYILVFLNVMHHKLSFSFQLLRTLYRSHGLFLFRMRTVELSCCALSVLAVLTFSLDVSSMRRK